MSVTSTPSTSRSSSFASDASELDNLSSTARTILNTMCNDRDFTTINAFISPDVIVQNDDSDPTTSREALVKGWQAIFQRTPGFRVEIKEALVDEKQKKVWVRSEITGLPGGIRKESIDMMQFNEEGVLTSNYYHRRRLRARLDDDDDY